MKVAFQGVKLYLPEHLPDVRSPVLKFLKFKTTLDNNGLGPTERVSFREVPEVVFALVTLLSRYSAGLGVVQSEVLVDGVGELTEVSFLAK